MTLKTRSRSSPAQRLRINPSFLLAHTLDGRPYLAQDSEPYQQFWLTDREQQLLSLFSGRQGRTVTTAVADYLRLRPTGRGDLQQRAAALQRCVRTMHTAGVLLADEDDTSRYSQAIAEDYIAQRPFPQPLAQHIVQRGGIGRASQVLDLAGGPGDLALALARSSDHVSLLELSRGFLDVAARRAQAQGLALHTVHDSANRLLHHESPPGGYDVVTVSQALHWLDDVAVCRGLVRLLNRDGSFFVVHAATEVADDHPLAHLLGYDSILGAHPRLPFAEQVQPLQRRLALLFDALDAPDVQRLQAEHSGLQPGQRIAAAGVSLFRQRRPFGPGFARGYFTPRHIELSGMTPEVFWRDLHARCAARPDADCLGTQHWAVLHFQRGAAGLADGAWVDQVPGELGYEGQT